MIEVKSAKIKSHEARVASTELSAADQHKAKHIEVADKHAATQRASDDRHESSKKKDAERNTNS